MSYRNKGSMPREVLVTMVPDRSGNFVIETGADPTLTIEAALTYLNTLGGGTLVTKGAGQTWICETKIDIDVDDVTWYSDWSLTIQAKNALDAEVIEATGDRVHLIGLHLDANRANQSAPNGAGQFGGIHFEDSNNFKVLDCWIHDVRTFGIWAYRVSATPLGGEIGGCLLENCDWNGIQIGTTVSPYANHDVTIHDCRIDGFSDVGISLFGSRNLVVNCHAVNGFGTNGFADSGYGFGVETSGKYNRFINCQAYDCRMGVAFVNNAAYNRFSNGTVINEGTGIGEWASMAVIEGDFNQIVNTDFIDLASQANDLGVKIQGGDNNFVKDCFFQNLQEAITINPSGDNSKILRNAFDTCAMGLAIGNAACDDTWVDDNDFIDCTDDVSDAGTGTVYGYNRDKDGNWDEGVEP